MLPGNERQGEQESFTCREREPNPKYHCDVCGVPKYRWEDSNLAYVHRRWPSCHSQSQSCIERQSGTHAPQENLAMSCIAFTIGMEISRYSIPTHHLPFVFQSPKYLISLLIQIDCSIVSWLIHCLNAIWGKYIICSMHSVRINLLTNDKSYL